MSLTSEVMWPDSASIRIKGQKYLTPEGDFPRVTTKNKTLGIGTEGLVKWSANLERAAVLEAAGLVFASDPHITTMAPQIFLAAIEARLGSARQHQRALQKGGDIGTEVHSAIQRFLADLMSGKKSPAVPMSDAAAIAFQSWRVWWAGARLEPVRIEQVLWDPEWNYAGTADLIARCLSGSEYGPEGTLIVPDWKSSNGVYESYHLQLAAYVRAARRWVHVEPGPVVRLPKDASKGLEVEVVPLGHMYDGRILTLDQLLECFHAVCVLHDTLVEKPEDR